MISGESLPHLAVRASRAGDLPAMLAAYSKARMYMRAQGNAQQWIGGYPSEILLREDIREQRSYVVTVGWDGPVAGTFCFFVGEEPTYKVIEGPGWLDDAPYGVIHRLASAGICRGVLDAALTFAYGCCENLRVDTHRDNHTMLTALKSRGFRRCGVIRLADSSLRIAFQRSFPVQPIWTSTCGKGKENPR